MKKRFLISVGFLQFQKTKNKKQKQKGKIFFCNC